MRSALALGSHNMALARDRGRVHATVGEPNPGRRLALADRIASLHDGYGQELTVREQLAKALG